MSDMKSEKRAYFWGNFYLSSIQQGIQALHCVSEMFCEYPLDAQDDDVLRKSHMLHDWAMDHKTVVVLNGGDQAALQEIFANLSVDENDLPYAGWNEDRRALNDCLTCVGIIVDEKIIANVEEVRQARKERRKFNFTERLNDFEYWLVMQIANTNMAR